MSFLSAFGALPEMVLGLAFSFGCALVMAFVCLRILVGVMTRPQHPVTHNGNDDPSHSRSIAWLSSAVGRSNGGPGAEIAGIQQSEPDRRDTNGGPHLVPAAPAVHGFSGIPEPDHASTHRLVEFPVPVGGGVGQSWGPNDGDAA